MIGSSLINRDATGGSAGDATVAPESLPYGRGSVESRERLPKKIQELQGTLDKLAGGGRLKETDLKQALNPDEYKRFVDAKTTDERKAVLEGAKKRVDAEVESGKTPENSRRIQAHLEEALSKPIDIGPRGYSSPSGVADKRLQQIKDVAIGAGLTPEQAEAFKAKVQKQFPTTWYGSGPLGGKDKLGDALDADTIKGIMEMIKADMGEAAAKSQIIADALKNGVGPTKLGMLQSIKAQFPMAFPKEMQASQIDFGSVRSTFQNASLNKDPLELEILKATRDEAIKQTAAAKMAIAKLDDLLKLLGR